MLSNMASSLILHKRITTTVAKAKALRKYLEPIITRAKDDTTHSRRVVFSYLGNKESVKELFSEVAEKVANRPGGYTRILKTGNRLGDNADMCIMELVDFNEFLLKEAAPEKGKTRRSRRGKSKKKAEVEAVAEESVIEDAEVVEDSAEVDTQEDVSNEVESSEDGEANSGKDEDKSEEKE